MPIYTTKWTRYTLITKRGTYAICISIDVISISYFKCREPSKIIWFWIINDMIDIRCREYINEETFHNVKLDTSPDFCMKFCALSNLLLTVHDVALIYGGMKCLKAESLINNKDSRMQLCWLFGNSPWEYYDDNGKKQIEFFYSNFDYLRDNSETFDTFLIAIQKLFTNIVH